MQITRDKQGSRRRRSDQRGMGPRTTRGIQIGPRIRVGGTLGKIGQQAKIGLGKVAKTAAPFVSFVNPAIGAALGAAGTAMDTSKGRVGLGNIAMSAAMNGGIGKAAGLIPGADKVVGRLGDLARGLPGAGKVGDLVNSVKGSSFGGLISGGGSDGQGNLGSLGDLAGKVSGGIGGALGGGGGGSALDKLLLGGAVAAAAADQHRRTGMENRAADYATKSYDSRAPLRTKGLAMAMSDEKPDLSAIFRNDGNVYDAARRGTPTKITARIAEGR